jgi:putative transposase
LSRVALDPVAVDDAGQELALNEAFLAAGRFVQAAGGDTVQLAHAAHRCLVQQGHGVGCEYLALDTGVLHAVAQVLRGVLGRERVDVQSDVEPRVQRPIPAHAEQVFQLGQAHEHEGKERLRVPLVVEEDVEVAQHLLVEQVRLIEEEDREDALLGQVLDVSRDGVEDRGSGGVRGEAQGEAELAVEVPAAECGVVAIGQPKAGFREPGAQCSEDTRLADRSGYLAHPCGVAVKFEIAGSSNGYLVSWSNGEMRLLSISRMTEWVRRSAQRFWSKLDLRGSGSEIAGIAADSCRRRRELVVENALLRHQLNVLRRQVSRPRLDLMDRLKLVLGSALLPSWRRSIAIVQPDTILRWHRAGFRLFWRARTRHRKESSLPAETIGIIRDMARRCRLWGAERIRGELLKLGIKVSKRTIQKYMRGVRTRGGGQTWATFLKNHSESIWACDFVQTYDMFFRQVYAFFIVHLASRRVVHVAATRNPTREWTAQQLRNATMDGEAPRVLLRDRDDKFGSTFDRVAEGAGIRVIKIAVRAPNMNAVAERFVGSVRREMLDHVLLLDDRHLDSLAQQYKAYFNDVRPHQGIGQLMPANRALEIDKSKPIVVTSVLGGLHADYRRAA